MSSSVAPTPAQRASAARAFVGTSVAWGLVFYLTKLSVRDLTPLGTGFGRCACGALTLGLLARWRGRSLPRGARVWAHLWVVGLLASVIPGVLVPLAETRVTSALAGIAAGMIPLATLLFLVTVFRDERVHSHQLAGLAVGFAGIVLVTGVWRGTGTAPGWALAALGGVLLSYGAAFPYIKRFVIPHGIDPLSLAATQQLLSAITLLPLFLLDGWHTSTHLATSVVATVVLGVAGGGFAFMWNFEVVAVWGSSTASTVEYTAALVAVAAGVVLLHESVQWNQMAGGVIVLIGALIGWGQIPSLRRASPTSH